MMLSTSRMSLVRRLCWVINRYGAGISLSVAVGENICGLLGGDRFCAGIFILKDIKLARAHQC